MELGSIVFFRGKRYRGESVAGIISLFFRGLSAQGKPSTVSSHDRVSCITIVADGTARWKAMIDIQYLYRN